MRTGTTQEVVDAFIRGENARTPSAPVPGGHRVTSEAGELRSYRTVVAVRQDVDGIVRFGVTTKKYSVTTSKLLGRVVRSINGAGFGHPVTGETVLVEASVPGRWGGFGPAWHPTGVETVPFVVFD